MTEIMNEGDMIIAKLRGDLDHHSVTLIRQELDAVLELSTPDMLIIDFNDVSFMDSSGIGLILGRLRVMKSFGGKVRLKNTNDYISKLLTMAGLSSLIIPNGKVERNVKNGTAK